MPTSAARPERLHQYARDTGDHLARLTRLTDDAARALTRFLAAGGRADAAVRATTRARAAVERGATVAAVVERVARAFDAADALAGRPSGPARAAADDVLISQTFLRTAPGLVDDTLLAPIRHRAGEDLAAELLALPVADQAEALTAIEHHDGYGPAFAAGLLHGLGADHLSEIVGAVAQAYEDGALDLSRADSALTGLAHVLQEASATVEAVTGPDQAWPTAGASPYALDAGLIPALGATATGRRALRNLALGLHDLPPQLTAAIATATLSRHGAADDDGSADAGWRRLLPDRLERHGLQQRPDLAVLRLLAADPLAAWRWEVQAGPHVSPTARNLHRHVPAELDAMAAIVDTVLTRSVRNGWARPWAMDRTRVPAPRGSLSERPSLPAIAAAVDGLQGSPALSRALARAHRTNPEFFQEAVAVTGYQAVPNDLLVGYFAVVAQDREALAAAVAASLGHYLREAEHVVARTDLVGANVSETLGRLSGVHAVTLALEAGAARAGRHHDAALDTGLTVLSFGVKALAGTVGKLVGPPAVVGGFVATLAARAGAGVAHDRWVDTDDGRSQEVSIATERAEPYLLAVAMAADERWGPMVVGPRALAGLDVVRSARDRATFRRWLAHQRADVAAPITALIEASAIGGGP